MRKISIIKDMQAYRKAVKAEDKTVGFVPTMGALHEGHLSLVRQAISENDVVIVSIFVNPTQFGPDEDFGKYPRDTEGDLRKLSEQGVHAVFLPDDKEMYPVGFSTSVDVGEIGNRLCGRSRPGHFNGVATVVAKLFNIVRPDRAYFGQKDFQQTVVIKKLVIELDFDADIVVCPTVRENDGLAMSSRNAYLSDSERKAATILYRSLHLCNDLITEQGMTDAEVIKREMKRLIESESLAKIDYIEVVDGKTLSSLKTIKDHAAICIAINIGNTRLIDNIIVM
jgi:pantoate--beta-alanine ligase